MPRASRSVITPNAVPYLRCKRYRCAWDDTDSSQLVIPNGVYDLEFVRCPYCDSTRRLFFDKNGDMIGSYVYDRPPGWRREKEQPKLSQAVLRLLMKHHPVSKDLLG